jgi:hypothetical protein
VFRVRGGGQPDRLTPPPLVGLEERPGARADERRRPREPPGRLALEDGDLRQVRHLRIGTLEHALDERQSVPQQVVPGGADGKGQEDSEARPEHRLEDVVLAQVFPVEVLREAAGVGHEQRRERLDEVMVDVLKVRFRHRGASHLPPHPHSIQ